MASKQTVTVDTANSKWVHPDGYADEINGTGETFVLKINDLGATAQWMGGTTNNSIALASGSKLNIAIDEKMSRTPTLSDGTAQTNAMSLWCRIDGGQEQEVKVTTMQAADVDGNNTDLTMTFEYPGKPWKWTWSSINTTAA